MYPLGSEETRNLREEDRRVVGSALANGVSHLWSDEESIMAKQVTILGLGVGSQRQSQAVDQPHIGQVGRHPGEFSHQKLRDGSTRTYEY